MTLKRILSLGGIASVKSLHVQDYQIVVIRARQSIAIVTVDIVKIQKQVGELGIEIF